MKYPKYIKVTFPDGPNFGEVKNISAGGRGAILMVDFISNVPGSIGELIEIGWPPKIFCDCSDCSSAIEISEEEYIAASIINS